jgi:riboflavin synthase
VFSGIVAGLGTVRSTEKTEAGRRLIVELCEGLRDLSPGDSLAVNGVCLTVVEQTGRDVALDVVPETLSRTNLGPLEAGSRVNLEASLRMGDSMSGHWVQGHVDATGVVDAWGDDPQEGRILWVRAPDEVGRYVVTKGSIAVDGVSLTVRSVDGDRFSVALIPVTLELTTLGRVGPGDRVNLEADLLGKYVEQLLAGYLERTGQVRG